MLDPCIKYKFTIDYGATLDGFMSAAEATPQKQGQHNAAVIAHRNNNLYAAVQTTAPK